MVLSPHAGEFKRLVGDLEPRVWLEKNPVTLVLKGPHTQIFDHGSRVFCLGSSSVLARGGSGDLLTGMLATLLSKRSLSPMEASCLAVQWHGRAAEILARQHGQESVCTTEILIFILCLTQ